MSEVVIMNQYENYHNGVADAHDIQYQVMKNFILTYKHSSTLCRNIKEQFGVKQEAFNILDGYYKQNYNMSINKLLQYKERDDEVNVSTQQCVHHLIEEIHKIVYVLKTINVMPKFQSQMFIFLPYCKQLIKIIEFFKNDYCCKVKIEKIMSFLNQASADWQKCLDTIKSIHRKVQVMMVFTDPKLYECNICGETSAEEHFLKPNDCCGYEICAMCYAQLWQHCTLYPVCPVCKMSFKTTSDDRLSKNETISSAIVS